MINIHQLLAENDLLLADGATGTNLFAMGLEPGMAPEVLNIENPAIITELHQKFISAGSDVILSNSFGGSGYRLKLHNLDNEVYEINKRAGELAIAAAQSASRPVAALGSVGPTGELPEPLGQITTADMTRAFVEQIEGLKAGGIDTVIIETMSAPAEIHAAAAAAIAVGVDYCVSASFDTAGKTMMGLEPENIDLTFNNLARQPIAYGGNCGVGPSDLLLAIVKMAKKHPRAILYAKANCGIPQATAEGICYSGTPELMAKYIELAADAGARIIGGCCGTTFEHIKAMRQAMDDYLSSERWQERQLPTSEQITADLGEYKAPEAAADDIRLKRKTRRRSAR